MSITSTYYTNKVFEENLNIDFIITDGTFSNTGQYFIAQNPQACQNILELTSFDDIILGTIDSNNYFTKEIRWSFDSNTWSNFILLSNLISTFPNPNTNKNVWFQIKYTWNSDNIKPVILQEINLRGTRKIDPIFEPVIITNKPVVYTNQDTYKVFNVTDFKAYFSNYSTVIPNGFNIQFRYTQTQGRTWSDWTNLTTANLVATKFDPIKFCNFQFGFTNTSGNDIKLYDLELIGEFQNITAAYATTSKLGLKTQCNPLLTELPPTGPCDPNCISGINSSQSGINYGVDGCSCCVACSESNNTPWSIVSGDVCDDNATNTDLLWKKNSRVAYGKLPELNNYLNNIISVTDGWKVQYGLTDPDGKGSDPILHEHQLYNVISIKDINIVVPDNAFPTTDISLSSLDLDLIQTFEIHIVKDQFKKVFGVEFRPGTRDILYLCDMNQLWEVDQMIPTRAAFNQETYWRVRLIKYNDRKSRKFVNSPDKAFVDALTKHTTLDGLLGIQQDNEYQRVSKNADILLDNNSQQFSHQTVLNVVESYHNNAKLIKENIVNSSLIISESQYKLPLTSKGLKLVSYNYSDKNINAGDNRAISMWFKTEKFEPTWEYSIFNNYDFTLNKGYKLDIFNNLLNFKFNNDNWSLPLNSGLLPNVWYCIFVNLYQSQNELELVVYKRQQEDGKSNDSKLIQVVKQIWQINPQSFSHLINPFIGGVDLHTNNSTGVNNSWYLTNIRIYRQQLAKAKRNIILNEKVIKDSHLTLLIDNAEQDIFYLPDVGNI